MHWAIDLDIGSDEVKSIITSKFAELDVNVATKDIDEAESDDDPVATILQPSITGAKTRDKHPPKQVALPITDQSKMPKMAP